jgi:hypothetical protein
MDVVYIGAEFPEAVVVPGLARTLTLQARLTCLTSLSRGAVGSQRNFCRVLLRRSKMPHADRIGGRFKVAHDNEQSLQAAGIAKVATVVFHGLYFCCVGM